MAARSHMYKIELSLVVTTVIVGYCEKNMEFNWKNIIVFNRIKSDEANYSSN